MSWIQPGADRSALLNTLPGIGDRYAALEESFFHLPQLPAEVVELCRLRIAQMHDAQEDLNHERVALAASKRSDIANWHRSDLFSEAERACIELTEMHVMDTRTISDAQADAVKAHFGDAGLVALIEAIGVLDGNIRLGLLWRTR